MSRKQQYGVRSDSGSIPDKSTMREKRKLGIYVDSLKDKPERRIFKCKKHLRGYFEGDRCPMCAHGKPVISEEEKKQFENEHIEFNRKVSRGII